jgi:hypothetical protein
MSPVSRLVSDTRADLGGRAPHVACGFACLPRLSPSPCVSFTDWFTELPSDLAFPFCLMRVRARLARLVIPSPLGLSWADGDGMTRHLPQPRRLVIVHPGARSPCRRQR